MNNFNHRFNGGMELNDKTKKIVLSISIISGIVALVIIILTVIIALIIHNERKRNTYATQSMLTLPNMPYGQTMEGSSIFNKRSGSNSPDLVLMKSGYTQVPKPLGRPNLNRKVIRELKDTMVDRVDNNKFYTINELIDTIGQDNYNKLVNNHLLVTTNNSYSPVDINNCFDLLNQIYSDMILYGTDSLSDQAVKSIISSTIFKQPQAESYTKDEVIAAIGKPTLDELIDLNYLIDAESYPKAELVGIYKKVTGEPDKLTYIPYLMQDRIRTKNIERD